MKTKDIFYLISKNKKEKIKSVFLGTLITIVFMIFLIIVSLDDTIVTYVNKMNKISPDNRTLIFDAKRSEVEDVKSKLNQINNIEGYQYSNIYSIGITGENFEWLYLNSLPNNSLPKTILGSNVIESGQIICPEKLITQSDLYNSLYSEEVLGKKFNAQITDNYSKEFQVVGVFDANKYMIDNNICYATLEDVNEIYNVLYDINVENDSRENFTFQVVVDYYQNIDIVKDKLETFGFVVDKIFFWDYKMFLVIAEISWGILFFVLAIILILITFNIKKMISERQREIDLYKSIGYNKNDIKKIYLYEIWLPFVISTIVAMFFVGLGYLVLKRMYSNTIISNIEIKFGILELVVLTVVGIIIPYIFTKIKLNNCIKRKIVRL